jgi:hypothetical protein
MNGSVWTLMERKGIHRRHRKQLGQAATCSDSHFLVNRDRREKNSLANHRFLIVYNPLRWQAGSP